MARHAELQTVDANQTVFLQGLYNISNAQLYKFVGSLSLLARSSLIIRRYDLLLSVLGLIGEVGGDFYFVLQGSVAIEIDNKVIKVSAKR